MGTWRRYYNAGKSRKALRTKNKTRSTETREIHMPAIQLRLGAFSAAIALLAVTSDGARAQKKYETGANDNEIKIGNITPYSGTLSVYGVITKTEQAQHNNSTA